MGKWIDAIVRWSDRGGQLAIFLMIIHVSLDVIGKNIFNAPIPSTIEIVSFWYMVAVIFLPLALIEKTDNHISVELLSQFTRGNAKAALYIFNSLVTAVYFALLCWFTSEAAMRGFRSGEFVIGMIPVPTWPTRFFVPVACGLMVIVSLSKILNRPWNEKPRDGSNHSS